MESKIAVRRTLAPALRNAVQLWAEARTDPESPRRQDLLRDKTRAVGEFFTFTDKHPGQVTPLDVATWSAHLEDQGLAAATIYHRLSQVSSWYKWALSDEQLREAVKANPVELARPKPPKAYHESQALGDETLRRLLAAVARDTLTELRDYALLLWYLLTGHRRSEVCRLTWGDLVWEGEALTVRFLVKGGDFVTEVVNPLCWKALREYLEASGRLRAMEPDAPLWVGHDRAGQANGQLSSHAFAQNLKRYARKAGIEGRVHVHQLRHSFARILADEQGSLTAVQEALGHKNLATTRVYVESIRVKPDRHSQAVAERLGL
jgi:site-specific recombinase XerD